MLVICVLASIWCVLLWIGLCGGCVNLLLGCGVFGVLGCLLGFLFLEVCCGCFGLCIFDSFLLVGMISVVFLMVCGCVIEWC